MTEFAHNGKQIKKSEKNNPSNRIDMGGGSDKVLKQPVVVGEACRHSLVPLIAMPRAMIVSVVHCPSQLAKRE